VGIGLTQQNDSTSLIDDAHLAEEVRLLLDVQSPRSKHSKQGTEYQHPKNTCNPFPAARQSQLQA